MRNDDKIFFFFFFANNSREKTIESNYTITTTTKDKKKLFLDSFFSFLYSEQHLRKNIYCIFGIENYDRLFHSNKNKIK